MYRIARCLECHSIIHVHQKGNKTILRNRCEHVSPRSDIYFITDMKKKVVEKNRRDKKINKNKEENKKKKKKRVNKNGGGK